MKISQIAATKCQYLRLCLSIRGVGKRTGRTAVNGINHREGNKQSEVGSGPVDAIQGKHDSSCDAHAVLAAVD